MGGRILIVDDSQDLLDAYELVLRERTAHEVRTAGSGIEALEIVRAWRPDLVVIDLVMPEINGLELIGYLRRTLPAPQPEFVALSGFTQLEAAALREGFGAFQPKPMDADDLIGLIDASLGPSSPPDLLRHKAMVRRRMASKAAEEALATALAQHEQLDEGTGTALRFLSGYFGGVSAMLLLMRKGALRVLESSDAARFPRDMAVEKVLAGVTEVLESGASLVVPDLRLMPALCKGDASRAGFHASVAIRSRSGTSIGTATLVSDVAQRFTAPDLAILEHAAWCATDLLSGGTERRFLTSRGLLQHDSWRTMLTQELGRPRPNRVTGVALLEIDTTPDRTGDRLLQAPLPARTALGELRPGRLAIYTTGTTTQEARRSLRKAGLAVQGFAHVRYGASIQFVGLETPRDPDAVLEIVEAVLRTAIRRGPGTLMRAVLEPENVAAPLAS